MKVTKLLLCFLVVTGCTNEEKIGKTPDDNAEIVYNFEHEIDHDSSTFIYDGKPLNIKYKVDNKGSDFEIGFFIAINGYLQNFDYNNQNSDMALLTVEKNKTNFYNFYLKPQIGKKNQKMKISFFTLLNPNTEPKTMEEENFRFNLNQLQTYDLISRKDIKEEKNIYIKSDYISKVKNDMQDTNSLFDVKYFQDNEEMSEALKKSKETIVQISGPSNEYPGSSV